MRPEPYDETVNTVNQVPSTLGWIVAALFLAWILWMFYQEYKKLP